jgi:hypothetical protein
VQCALQSGAHQRIVFNNQYSHVVFILCVSPNFSTIKALS